MGWNDVESLGSNPLFDGLEVSRFYFLHSYCISDGVVSDSIACAHYGRRFAASISKSNIHGVQFHPEKSHHWGVKLLENFANL
jgi:glutamine amidotransferase